MARILVIDDDPEVLATINMMLKRAGHEVTSAKDGRAGLARFQESRPDLVITDIIMPDQEGIQTLLEIRKLDPGAKVLVISGGTRVGDFDYLHVARRLGATQVLAKPFGATELLTAVDGCLLSDSTGSESAS